MAKVTYILLAIGLLLLTAGSIRAQEQRMRSKMVSTTIQDHIKTQYPGATHLRYYTEQVHDSLFVEAELRDAGSLFSLKFLANQCVEVERDIQFEDIPPTARQAISKRLDSIAAHYLLLTCQEVNPGKGLVYEIEFKQPRGPSRGFYVVYFDPQGQLIRLSSMVVRPIDSQF
jgi:hypothetical protein